MDGLAKFSNNGTVKPTAVCGTDSPRRWLLQRLGRALRGWGRRPRRPQWCLVGALAFCVACATMPHGATEANMTLARSSAAEGWAMFKEHCAGCHGERGESVSNAPRIMGPGALPEYPRERNVNADPASGDPELLRLRAQTRPAGAPWRDPFRTAQDLQAYISREMPPRTRTAGSLSAEQYWSITGFMLRAHGVELPPEGVNAANASSVKLQVGRP
jgi:hypothetical protein